MSANNYAICPICYQRERNKIDAGVSALMKSSGMSASDALVAWAAVNNSGLLNPSGCDTLRENYELGVGLFGEFFVSYSCRCDKCGTHYEFEFKENVLNTLKGEAKTSWTL